MALGIDLKKVPNFEVWFYCPCPSILRKNGSESFQAAAVTADIIAETGEKPYVLFELIPSGVVGKLRYRVVPTKRQTTSTLIVERISNAFRHEDRIEFAYVKRESLLRPKDETSLPPQYLYTQQFRERPLTDRIE